MKTKIGGQAVIEGVMMRGATSMALTVRDELGQMRTETTRLSTKKPWYKKIPFLRGIINLVVSMLDGTKIISKSAEVLVEEEIDTSNESMGGLMFVSTLLGLALALGLFVVLPTAITTGVFALFHLDVDNLDWAWLKSLIEGVAKMGVLIGYMSLVSQMREIKRVFMYHGAEHKTIACYEAEMDLTVENVQKCSRYHDRCGTSFLVFTVVLSVILMMVLDVVCAACNFTMFLKEENWWLRALLKIGMLPLTAGVSYEVLMLLANSNFVLFRPLKWMGKQFQKITTKEPTDDMCEVAIKSFVAVLEMDADPTIAEVKFPEPLTVDQFKQQVANSELPTLVGTGDVDWLTTALLHLKTEDLTKDIKIPFGWVLRLQKACENIKNGQPWQQALGTAEFFGRNFTIDKNVLVPRQETELVCEQALKHINDKSKVLDLCCGSGVLGITIALEKGAKVTLGDISKDAINVAKLNNKKLKAKAKVIKTDMFANINGKFDVIVCNPPYIESDVIPTLDESVRNYEPHIALDGGADGLDFYRILAKQAAEHLNPNGTLVLEIGYNQGDVVCALLADKFDAQFLKDYSNNDRIVIAKIKNH
ncbi:MAG: peptide chain release factor N(5)-glutamine methyltransferase [Clostridia bacterium]|nr:peptide chain release factor N(5)-glutamine methyltransferase [Clostridia bacterium]